jgi:hypothetical protein
MSAPQVPTRVCGRAWSSGTGGGNIEMPLYENLEGLIPRGLRS